MNSHGFSGAVLPALLVFIFTVVPAMGQAALRAPTPTQTEGPYFSAGSPERRSLRDPRTVGTSLRLSGRVLDRAGNAMGGVRLDFWQADGRGRYDNRGFELRGHQFTDSEGRYVLETVLPGLYTGRARHIHVKVVPNGRPPLTTQVYFSGDEGNARDPLVDPRLLVDLTDGPEGKTGVFDFILDTGR